ncbi:RNA polymerase sigma factor [Nocardia blacklockiae]|uniref:RNA polymerase sigma factor n=1 Tax=Nocardia blacklockiae TaxID=480036 RepID=UPI001894152E|nr:RNA polymerase sigma factor [Nocardia blacklockiae]MBF6173611.1 RNA polymerase sigma factor [Nocardia blacklockiae]
MSEHPPPHEDDAVSRHEGFDNLYKIYATGVYHYAHKALRGDVHAAHDVVQAVFTCVWDQFERDFADAGEAVVERLLKTITARRVLDAWRAAARRPVPVAEYLDSDVPMFRSTSVTGNPLDQMLEDQEVKNFLHVLLMSLTETEYQVALMVWILGLPDREVAEIMGVAVTTVRTHKSRARRKISTMVRTGRHRITFDTDPALDRPDLAWGGELWA